MKKSRLDVDVVDFLMTRRQPIVDIVETLFKDITVITQRIPIRLGISHKPNKLAVSSIESFINAYLNSLDGYIKGEKYGNNKNRERGSL